MNNRKGQTRKASAKGEQKMTKSERLAKEGKISVYIGSVELATVIKNCNAMKNLRYIGTDYDAIYDSKNVCADVYENTDGELFAVLS